MIGRRWPTALLGGLALVAVVLVWGLPNVAGRTFVEVRLVATSVASAPGQPERQIVLGDDPLTAAGALSLAIRIEGRYPLPVVVAWTSPPLRVELRTLLQDGSTKAIQTLTGSSADLEEGSDSPMTTTGDEVVLVRPGVLELPLGPSGGMPLTDQSGDPLGPGVYVLQAWALGIPAEELRFEVIE